MEVAIALISVSITSAGTIAYLIGIIKGGTRPRMASWVAWGTANATFTAVALSEAAYLAAGINGIATITNIVVIIASIKKGVDLRPVDWIDWSCLTASVLCVVVTVVSPSKEISALTGMLANLTATIPTIRHAWVKPREETWQLFAANVTAGCLGVLGIVMASGELHFAAIAGPLITAAGNIGLVMITLGRRWRLKQPPPEAKQVAAAG